MDPSVPVFRVQPQPTPKQAIQPARHVSEPWSPYTSPKTLSKEPICIDSDDSSTEGEACETRSNQALDDELANKPALEQAADAAVGEDRGQISKGKAAKTPVKQPKRPRKRELLALSRLSDDDKLLAVRLAE